ncbi:replication-associated recombination protein A [Candidatus Microgenomates bacterium]|nr:MAG: replication-associated recombination protein A [Candidatus Microgenomates bacterium]
MELTPLAERLRPQTLTDYIGQEHLIGKTGVLTRLISQNALPSMIFWGPPGSGKTTLAYLIAKQLDAYFEPLSAVSSKLDDVRRVIKLADERKQMGKPTILFVDEIHRFNKAQQDAFLPHVERGTIILIGATTENPSFEVIGPLLSRCRVLVLKQLNPQELEVIAQKALQTLKKLIEKDAQTFLLETTNGDARRLINTLEIAASIASKKTITIEDIEAALQKKQLSYDKAGEEHYDTISAFIKSMRASQPDAALYYLARMVEAGEDPLFIARRMVVFASEDIGMAAPTALVVANEVFRACETIGYPECAINLAHGVVYLSLCKKDRRAYDGLRAAQADVVQFGNLPIPLNIRNAPTKLMKNLGYGKGYDKYDTKSYLPEKLKGKKYF